MRPPRHAIHAMSLAALLACSVSATLPAAPLTYYLPAGVEYDQSIPTPDEVLGYGVGTWHVRPDQVIDYMRRLAAASPRVTLEVQGRTHEDRLQILLTITSESNHEQIEAIRRAHIALSNPDTQEPTEAQLQDMPVVVWLGYSIHGNEPSGTNASLLAAYHFAAAIDAATTKQLSNAVILLDPMYNPDGLGRFAHWANMHKGNVLVADPNNREHTEPFPSGRMNHYWFDLNRDWLLLQHPESRNRVENFHRWKPNLLTDHHEMGTNSTFFFQPGVPERKNPLIPEGNLDLTNRLARFHAAALDAENRLYYSQESFDDFYPGKGSTYPDLNGAVGILFEQASARGHLQESVNGDLAFSFGIKNHFLASLSSVKGAVADRIAFLQHQVRFFRQAKAQADASDTKAYVLSMQGDQGRRQHLLDNLSRHQIAAYRLATDITVGQRPYRAGEAVVVPLAQTQSLLVRSLFESLTDFNATTFYDVSTWSLPLAFGATFDQIQRSQWRPSLLGQAFGPADVSVRALAPPPAGAFAYAFRWNDYHAPRALYRLLAHDHKVRVATQPFSVKSTTGGSEHLERFGRGTIVVSAGLPGNESIQTTFSTIAREDGIEVLPLATGLTDTGIDLGSPSLRPLARPKIMVVVGPGVSAYEAGETWHLLDKRFQIPVSLVEADRIPRIDLGRYTHIVLPGGSYGRYGEGFSNALTDFARSGGTLIGIKGGATFLDSAVRQREVAGTKENPTTPPDSENRATYNSYREERAKQLISGTIVATHLDLTHPLAYGYQVDELPVFRTNSTLLPRPENPYEVVSTYASTPRISGYISEQNQQRLSGQPAILASRFGGGTIIQILDNPNFRAIWYGTSKLFLNSIFFGPIVQPTSAPGTWFQ